MTVTAVARIGWADHLELMRRTWRQGEHVALVGPTGVGKTTAALDLVPLRAYSVIFATKARDRTLRGLTRDAGYLLSETWPPPNDLANRVLLWPPWRTRADNRRQADVFSAALDGIMAAGGWCVLADDTEHLTDDLGMAPALRTAWNQARAVGVSLVTASQRPRRVPVACWANASHFYLWSTPHPDDLRAVRQLGGVNTSIVAAALASMESPHDLLYVNARTRTIHATNTRA